MKTAILLSLATILAGSASATPRLNEIMNNPPSTDNGFEFVEILSTTGGAEALTNVWFVVIEGDGTAPGAGVVDIAIDLSSLSTGANGLLLLRDGTTGLLPAAAAQTTVANLLGAGTLENGTQTFLLVTGFTGSTGTDYDTDDNGTLDSTPWTAVLDAVGTIEDDANPNTGYGASLGFTDLSEVTSTFEHEALVYDASVPRWVAANISGTSPGPYTIDVGQSFPFDVKFDGYALTPGNGNGLVAVPAAAQESWSLYE
ncbi:MAG: hypothetical protein SF028_11230 [Candidatus Sumerlaeia bacterium]|nr:hypothetical protein [Candidatus Sumerlaeia bacterium]